MCGTAFAFVFLLDELARRGRVLALPPGARIMETGGFKGRSRELGQAELYAEIEARLGVPAARIVNQYGMTELGSQFYDSVLRLPGEPRRKLGPPWTRVKIVDPVTGGPAPEHGIGQIVVVDLANTGSVLALQTADLGRRARDGFDVLGREPGAEARGCSIAADELLCRGGRVTAREIRDRLAELREAGVKLRRRPARETIAALARVLDLWASPDSSWRRRLEAELPGATGFGLENVREGLARGLAPFHGEAWLSLVRAELGDPARLDGAHGCMLSGFDTTAVVLAGAIPQPSLLALLAPLALRSPVLAKPASRDPVTAALVAESIAEVDPELGRCIAIARFGSGDEACLRALLEADCVAATGSDASIAALAARVQPPRRLVASGHRLSLAALGPEALRGEALGCGGRRHRARRRALGSTGLLVSFGGVRRRRGRRGARPAGGGPRTTRSRRSSGVSRAARQDAAAAAAFRNECDGAELRAAAQARVRLLGGAAQRWAVVREADAAPRPAPSNRFLRVQPVEDPEALLRGGPAARARISRAWRSRASGPPRTPSCAASPISAPRACAGRESSSRRRSPGTTRAAPCCFRSRGSRISNGAQGPDRPADRIPAPAHKPP